MYMKITLKVDFHQKKSGSGPYNTFTEGDQRHASLSNTDFLPPPLEKSCIRAWLHLFYLKSDEVEDTIFKT